MPVTERISVEVPSDVIVAMRARVAAGHYANESEAVTEALRCAQEDNNATDAWLRNVIAPICDSVIAGTATLLTPEEARKRLFATR